MHKIMKRKIMGKFKKLDICKRKFRLNVTFDKVITPTCISVYFGACKAYSFIY